MNNNIDYEITSLTNNLAILKSELLYFDERGSYFTSKEIIIELIKNTEERLIEAKKKKGEKNLKLEE